MSTNKPISIPQITKFHALLRSLNLDTEQKRDLIAQFTNGRSDRTNDLSFNEAHDLISHLATLAGEVPSPQVQHEQRRQREDRMRKKVIAIAYQLGWTRPSTGKLDYDRLSEFIKTHPVSSRLKITALNDYNEQELVKLVSQFQSLLKKHLEKYKNGG